MKFLIVFVFVVVASAVNEVRGYSIAETLTIGIKVVASRNSPLICRNKAGAECTEDCSTLMICSSFSTKPIRTTTCTAPNQYCVDGACTSNPGTKCQAGGGGSDFTCTDVGIFPEPSDCTRYHVCSTSGSTPYQCFAGFVFNSQLSMCQIGKTPCTKISCAKATEANPFMSYTSNPAYYAYCMKNDKGAFETIMFKCPYDKFEVFDLKTKECQFKCKARGNFQNPADCGKYFYCSGANAQPILEKCPTDLVFDGTGCNRDADKCQHKPTTTTTPDPLSGPATVDPPVIELIKALKKEIVAEICSIISNSDVDVCPAAPAETTEALDPKLYKTEMDDENMYFVSVTIKGKYYHVKIFNDKSLDSAVPILKGVKPKEDGDAIVYFE